MKYEKVVAIFNIYAGMLNFSGKDYTWCSQQFVVDHLKEWYGIKMCPSSFKSYLREMKKKKLIHSVPRKRRVPNGKILFRTTLISITPKAAKYMKRFIRLAHNVWSYFRVQKIGQYYDITYNITGQKPKTVDNFSHPRVFTG